jgi:hypothetical protein
MPTHQNDQKARGCCSVTSKETRFQVLTLDDAAITNLTISSRLKLALCFFGQRIFKDHLTSCAFQFPIFAESIAKTGKSRKS